MKKHILILLIFVILIGIFYIPITINPTSSIPWFSSSDEPLGLIWEFWILQNYSGGTSIKSTDMINYPFGMEIIPAAGYFSYIWFYLNYTLSQVASSLSLIWNIQVFTNFLLSAFFAFLLVYYLTKNVLSGLLAGIIFSFSPQHFVRSWQHLGLTYWQWIPLVLYGAILLKDKFTKKRIILFGIAVLFLLSFDYSIMYLGLIPLAVFLLYVIFYNWRIKFFSKTQLVKQDLKYVEKIFVVTLVALIVLLSQFLPIIKGFLNPSQTIGPSGYNLYRRPFEDLFIQSAKPLSYLLPSTEHPIFGNFTEHFVGSHLWGVSYTEHQLYLGWATILLALYAVMQWRKKRKQKRIKDKGKRIKLSAKSNELKASRDDFYIGFFVLLAVVGWLFSQPPWWQLGNIKIYMPSFFMYKILPMYRAYCRFGIVVLIAIAVLAGYGLKYIRNKVASRKKKVAISILFCGLILFEFWFNPFTHYKDLHQYPKVYDWLKNQEEVEVISEYPMVKEGRANDYLFYQTIHQKRLINGAVIGYPGYKTELKIVNLSDKQAPLVLESLDCNYIVVHAKRYKDSGNLKDHKEIKKIRNHPHLKLIKKFKDGVEVYGIRDLSNSRR